MFDGDCSTPWQAGVAMSRGEARWMESLAIVVSGRLGLRLEPGDCGDHHGLNPWTMVAVGLERTAKTNGGGRASCAVCLTCLGVAPPVRIASCSPS